MANRTSFKSDVSFLEKISIGAIGTQRVFEDLGNHGHKPIELERGSRSFKIWKKIKIKRIRVPDILCVACGHRVESRGKTAFEISMSHSFSDPERGWDYGLADTDYVALVVCSRAGDRPIDWQGDELVQYISVKELKTALNKNNVVFIRPKGAEEGFEARIQWPATVAKAPGTVSSINNERIQYKRDADNRTITLKLSKQGLQMNPLVSDGDNVLQNQVLASVVPVLRSFPCSPSVDQDHYLSRISNPSLSERYTAVKALSLFESEAIVQSLIDKLNEDSEHIFVRLEAAAGLARLDHEHGWSFIQGCLEDSYLQNRLEAVIILAEIPGDTSFKLLADVLKDDQQSPEIRAGAAWALGEIKNKEALSVLIDSFSAVDEVIHVEAARALAKLASRFTPEILGEFADTPPHKRPGIAWALSKSSKFKVEDLLDVLVDEDARHWIAYILGTQDQNRYIHQIEQLKAKDPEVYFAVTVLWKILTSWVYGLEEYG